MRNKTVSFDLLYYHSKCIAFLYRRIMIVRISEKMSQDLKIYIFIKELNETKYMIKFKF